MKKNLSLVIIAVIFAFLAITNDYYASQYGNGLIFKNYNLRFGYVLTFVENPWIMSKREGLCYLKSEKEYITSYSDTIQIKKFVGYNNETKDLLVKIETDSAKRVCLIFGNMRSLEDFNPEILNEDKCYHKYGSEGWIDLENKSWLVYYSKPIVLLLFISSAVFGSMAIFKAL